MDKLKLHTSSLADENYCKLAELFPNAVTETKNANGEVVRAIDADVLRQEISAEVVEGPQERYQFTWPDKKKSVVLANAPINKTLRPVRENETVPTGEDTSGTSYCSSGSVNFDTTQNLYIEGDNLEVLKLLQESYLGKIKMIYIDPPYNTGSDFIYEDDYSQRLGDYLLGSGQFDEKANRLVQNLESNGRFHTKWLNEMYPRLRIAKGLLSDDGAIFISVDDCEQENLKKICNEIFGEANFVCEIAWQCLDTVKNDAKYFSDNHEYILVYAKNLAMLKIQGIKKGEKQRNYYKNYDNDPRGDYLLTPLHAKSGTLSGIYAYTFANGQTWTPPQGTFPRFSKTTLKRFEEEKRIYLDPDGIKVPQKKTYFSETGDRMPPITFWDYTTFGSTRQSNKELGDLLGKGMFQNPKPTKMLSTLLDLIFENSDAIILDFFSGSATTAHAVMQLNAEDGGHRKFIMVQLPEVTDEKSEAYKAGYKNICEIGKERIRRAARKIAEENPKAKFDGGFRVLKCDTSNMKDVYYTPESLKQGQLELLADNIKPDRTPEDLLFQVMLDLGIPLSSTIEETEIAGKRVFDVAENHLLACFDRDITEETVTAIAKRHPLYAIFRDSAFSSDSVAINFDQIFATYSPKTTRRIL